MNLNRYESNSLNALIPNDRPQSAATQVSRSGAALLEQLFRFGILLLALLCLAATSLHACGPNFPNNLLDSGDYAVLVSPVLRFGDELERLKLVKTRWRAVSTTNDYGEEAAQAELSDLRAALKRNQTSNEDIARIATAHEVRRQRLAQYEASYRRWQDQGELTRTEDGEWHRAAPEGKAPRQPAMVTVPGLPDEFADYFEGAVAWRDPARTDKSPARAAWERLLERPEASRRFKSTWAAYMLGRSLEESEREKAIEYYRKVRELSAHGFKDSVGLATASLGWEARLELRQHNFPAAIHLYLEQLAAEDWSAVDSLRTTAASALNEGASLDDLAADSLCQRVITAYLISLLQPAPEENSLHLDPPRAALVGAWLQAVENAEIVDVASADKFALAAYQAGRFDEAQRWIERAPGSPLAQWLQAKLELRAGRIPEALARLNRISSQFPMEATGTNAPARLVDNLWVPYSEAWQSPRGAGAQVAGELGVLRLNHHQHEAALDALLRSGFWIDAAYVSERVLTLEELKSYVDRNWPESECSTNNTDPELLFGATDPGELATGIRYLLARRLSRALRGGEAREYYPAAWRSRFDLLKANLISGWDESLPAAVRARALFAAAYCARTNGIELLGTETGPDWRVFDGNYEGDLTLETRTNESFKLLGATTNELGLARAHATDPEVRFHYRYQAAFLAWEGAKLLPNNSDETAFMLWQAGVWLKNRDPITADGFYKALVRRCRKTELGAEADRIRWFPELDDAGHVVTRTLSPGGMPPPESEITPDIERPESESIGIPLLTEPESGESF